MKYLLLSVFLMLSATANAQTCTDLLVAEYPSKPWGAPDTVWTQSIHSIAKNKQLKESIDMWVYRNERRALLLYLRKNPKKFRNKDGNILWTIRFDNGVIFRTEGEQRYLLNEGQYVEYNDVIVRPPANLKAMLATQLVKTIEIKIETQLGDKIIPYTLDETEAKKLRIAAECLLKG